MVSITPIKTKDGKVYTSKEGVELVEIKLTNGDEFIPKFASPKADTSGEYPKYSIVAVVRDSETKKVYSHNKSEELYLSLTPTQYEYLVRKAGEGVEINQRSFNTHEYESHGKKCVGINLKGDFKEPVTFDELDKE